MRHVLLACALLLALYAPASDDLPLPVPIVSISPIEVSRGSERPQVFTATAYTATGNRTCTGTWPQEGRTVATDPAVIPHGSRLTIDGQPGYVAEDSGSLIRDMKIDLYLDSEEECILWGVRNVEVLIIN